jgi:adenylosuccinate synthase
MTRVNIEPEWKSFKGWKTDTSVLRKAGELPEAMKPYVSFINEYLGVGVNYISNGPGREQLINIQ